MKKILLVDDEVHILNILKFNLSRRGYEIVTAKDGVDALEALNGFIPDLLIIDVMMPKKSGHEVCQELKTQEKFKAMPIIMLSAKSQKEDFQKGADLGVHYMTKPFSPALIVNKVTELIGGP